MASDQDLISLLNEALKREQQKVEEGGSKPSLVAANDFYNKLLENGTIKKRGNTLRDISNPNLFHVRLNSFNPYV